MASHPRHRSTPSEYLALERKAEYKSEYVSGEIFAMTGASREHNIIAVNLGTELNTQLEGRNCEIYPAEMRVRTPDSSFYTYPDLVVVCGPPRFDDNCFDTLLNPTLLVEISSPSTVAYDRTVKFANFRKIASLMEYVLVAQDECRITQFVRQPGGLWLFEEADELRKAVHFSSIDCNVQLNRVYRRIEFPSQSELSDTKT